MPTREQYVAQLAAQVGEGEDPPGSNCNRYSLHALGVCAPWCAAGLKTCADDIGLDLPGWSGYCPTWEAQLRDAGDWFEADQVDQVQPGWAVFFDWYGTDESWHVEAVEFVDGEGVHTIGFNYQDIVARWLRTSCIRGFGRIRFDEPFPTMAPGSAKAAVPVLVPPPQEAQMPQVFSGNGRALDVDWFCPGCFAGDDADIWLEVKAEGQDVDITVFITLDDSTGRDGEHAVSFRLTGNQRGAICLNRPTDRTDSVAEAKPETDMLRGQGASWHLQATAMVAVSCSRYPRKVQPEGDLVSGQPGRGRPQLPRTGPR